MDKRAFERELRSQLYGIPYDKKEMYIGGYNNIIDGMISRGMTEEQAVASMGDPAVLAAKTRRANGSNMSDDNYSQSSRGNDASSDGYADDRAGQGGSYNNTASDGYTYSPANYGDGFDSNNSSTQPESVTGTVRDPNGGYRYSASSGSSSDVKMLRIIIIIILCFMFMPALIGIYIAAVCVFIGGAAAVCIGVPVSLGFGPKGVFILGVGLLLMGISILMMMGLNRLIKLITGHYRLIK